MEKLLSSKGVKKETETYMVVFYTKNIPSIIPQPIFRSSLPSGFLLEYKSEDRVIGDKHIASQPIHVRTVS